MLRSTAPDQHSKGSERVSGNGRVRNPRVILNEYISTSRERSSCLVTGTRMRGPEFSRFGPRLEGPLAYPHGRGGKEGMLFRLRPLEKMKLKKTWNTIEIRIASEPYFFKCVL